MPQIKVMCKICNKEQMVSPSRAKTYLACSKSCLGKSFKKKPNCKCSQCDKDIYKKPSKLKNSKLGSFCSVNCLAEYQKTAFLAEKNPNFKNIKRDCDGYKMIHLLNIGSFKHHVYVMHSILGIDKIPKGYHIHHRDCNKDNNLPENLVLLSISDHLWVHKQYGSAVLWAYSKKQIDLESLIRWSNDPERAKKLLNLTLYEQIGVFKSDKLLENPEEDNQQPIQELNALGGFND
jgi:hypothetical protein